MDTTERVTFMVNLEDLKPIVEKSVFCCTHCGWPLGLVVQAGNVSVLKLEGAAFVVILRKSEDVQCKQCGRATRWCKDVKAK